jgi:hypothetical protein
MKKFYVLFTLFFGLIQVYSQTQINLTFQAKDSLTQNSLDLDSVNIMNLEENCDTTLYDAISVLTLDAIWPIGIEDIVSPGSESFLVMQNVPNPFRGETKVSVNLKNDSEFTLAVFDNQGKNLSQFQNRLEKGWHQFAIISGGTGLLFLKASDGTAIKTIKLLSAGQGGESDRISYIGPSDQGHKNLKSKEDVAGFVFYLGNPLTYTAYVDGYYESILNDNPVSSENYTFAMLPVETATIPSVTTETVTNITPSAATSGGNVTSDGGEPVTVRGVCWSILPGPTMINDHTTDGSGTGSFVSNLMWLTPNTPYYIRAYATNSVGTAYGDELTFNTLAAELPTVTTAPATDITVTTATSGGHVTSDGGDFVTARGVCWSASPNPSLSGDHTLDGGGTGSFESYLSGLSPNTPYYIRAYATNTAGTAYGDELTFATLIATEPDVTTTPASDITQTTATSGGNVTSDGGMPVTERGVCWSTVTTPTLADSHSSDGTGTGTFVSNLTGLTPETPYYIRAYAINSIGTAYGNELTFNTLGGFVCGTSITINHIEGDVAPVTKTTTYATVTNIPGETSKCWITSNLGSDHQASTVNDATEASAGWYWQFNRMQGFKHDGTTVTPAWTITSINENSDWLPANDPCTVELGDGWRIPTSTEWTNVDVAGNWNDWNGPWNSDLRMHAAGYLFTDGVLWNRGSSGWYWSSTQSVLTESYILRFGSSFCWTDEYYFKADGFSVRCIREQR